MKSCAYSRICIAVATALLCVAGFPSLLAAQAGDSAVDNAEAQARQAWRLTMHHTSVSGEGCFHASYPNTQWEKVECVDAQRHHSARPRHTADEAMNSESMGSAGSQTTGDGYDYVAQSPAGEFFSSALGSFPTVTGVTAEKTVNVLFNGFLSDGIRGPNEYIRCSSTRITPTAPPAVSTRLARPGNNTLCRPMRPPVDRREIPD